jgi:hypothetical protein
MTGLDDATVLRTLSVLAVSGSLTVILALLALLFPRLGEGTFRRVETSVSRFAQRQTAAVATIFVSVIAVRLVALPLLPVPLPGIHDEFSYLLMADTFTHGRLANPPHPMWVSFETFHVNWFPRYASMYPPAQGFALALGQLLGHPWIGVLLSDATMCAAILWMLQGWLPATGGAMVLGALPRLVKHARIRDALVLGVGVAILANSRPYEGFLFCIPAAIWFVWWLAGKTKSNQTRSVRVLRGVVPVACVLALCAAFMSYYNWRLTGNPMQLPHTLNTQTYHTTGLFLWDDKKPEMHYRNQQFEDFYNGWERENYDNTWADVVRVSEEKLIRCGVTYFWAGELFLLPVIPFLFRGRKMRLLLATFALVTIGVFAVIWSNAHYAAPLTSVVFVLAVQAMRRLRLFRVHGRPIGVALSRAIVLLLVLDTGINVARRICDPLFWPCGGDPSRQLIAEKLANTPGKHLILVRYEQDHNIHDDWVYNGAEIDNAKVLWARELDAVQNAKLFAYFRDRKIWLVTPDSDNIYLEPYTPPGVELSYSDSGAP